MTDLRGTTTLVAIKIDCLQNLFELFVRSHSFYKELYFKHIAEVFARYSDIQRKIILTACVIKECKLRFVIKDIKIRCSIFISKHIVCSCVSVNTSADKQLTRSCRLFSGIAWNVEIVSLDAAKVYGRNTYFELVFVLHKHTCAHKRGGIIAFKERFFIGRCKGEIRAIRINGDRQIFICLCRQFLRLLICDFDDHFLGFKSDLGLHEFQVFFHTGHIVFHFIEEILAKERGFKRCVALRTHKLEFSRHRAIEHGGGLCLFLSCRNRSFRKHLFAFCGKFEQVKRHLLKILDVVDVGGVDPSVENAVCDKRREFLCEDIMQIRGDAEAF